MPCKFLEHLTTIQFLNSNEIYHFSYVKGIYLQQIDSKAPNYLIEEYSGTTPYLKEDKLKDGTCTVRLKLVPFHHDEPGLQIYYAHKDHVRIFLLIFEAFYWHLLIHIYS